MISPYVRECYGVRAVLKKLTRAGNSLAIVLDQPLLEQLRIDENTELELSTNGEVLVIAPVRDPGRKQKLEKILEKLNREYGGVFRRLAE